MSLKWHDKKGRIKNEQEKYEVIKKLVDHNGNKNLASKKLGISRRQIDCFIITDKSAFVPAIDQKTYVKNKYLKKIYSSNDSFIEIKFFSKTNWEKSQSIPICLSLFFRLVDTKNILRKLISMMWNMNLWVCHWRQLNKLYNYKWKWEYFPVNVF